MGVSLLLVSGCTPTRHPKAANPRPAASPSNPARFDEEGWSFEPLQTSDGPLYGSTLLVDGDALIVVGEADEQSHLSRTSVSDESEPLRFSAWSEAGIGVKALALRDDGTLVGSGVHLKRLEGALPWTETDVRISEAGDDVAVERLDACGFSSVGEAHRIVSANGVTTRARGCARALRVEQTRGGAWQTRYEETEKGTSVMSLSAFEGAVPWIVTCGREEREVEGFGAMPMDQCYGGDASSSALDPLDPSLYYVLVEYGRTGTLLLTAMRHAKNDDGGSVSQLVFSEGSPFSSEFEVVATNWAVGSLCTVGQDSRGRPFIVDDAGVWLRRDEAWAHHSLPASIAFINACAWDDHDRLHLLVQREVRAPNGDVKDYISEYATARFE
ncbi:MAG: hypothetical protein ACRBN8_18310 [Nannocystales bacterium]